MNQSQTNQRIEIRIQETDALIKTKEDECAGRKGSLSRQLLFNLFNDINPELQLNCLRKLLELLIELRDGTGQQKVIANRIRDLSQGKGNDIHRYHISATPVHAHGAGPGIGHIYTKPERPSIVYYDRTTQCFREARKLAEDIIKVNHETRLNEMPSGMQLE